MNNTENTVEKIDIDAIKEIINRTKDISVLVIGDTVIDQYTYVHIKGKAVKDPIVSVGFGYDELQAGGILAIANHVSDFVKNVHVVTLVGDQNPMTEFITKSVNTNIVIKAFVKENSPTIIKKRYIDQHRNNKLFKIEYMNDDPINMELSKEIVSYLSLELPKYDMVIVGDFGHGFINSPIRKMLEEKSKFLTANIQSNSANMGYNYITLLRNPDFLVANEEELRMPIMARHEDIENVIKIIYNKLGYDKFMVTLGKKGSILFDNGKMYSAPALAKSVKDTVGAGDALFAIASLLVFSKVDNKIIPFIANSAAGVKTGYMGNKEYVTKAKLLEFIKEVY